MIALLSILACLSLAQADYTPEALADQVKNLPGAEGLTINFNQFSGYLKVNGTKNMHYWLVESENNPATDPVAFWTNGGPGCSGLLGFMTEQGPFRPNKDLTLSLNEYAWNKIANMVFIESPCGVGFSYSDNPDADYSPNDANTAQTNYLLIQAFLTRFPQYRTNDLYITSESYGGHYMPTLAKQIVDENTNAATTGNPVINFKGFAVGNPATTFYSMIPAGMETFWGHQLISKPLYEQFTKYCKVPLHKSFAACEMILLAMYAQVGNLNPYALDYPVCVEDEMKNKGRKFARHGRNQRATLMNHLFREMQAASNRTETADIIKQIKKSISLEPVEGYEPCADDYMTTYLNQANVKSAIHVKSDIEWADCASMKLLKYDQSEGKNDMTPYYQYLIDGKFGLNILVYSGDDDDVCGTIGTQDWIWALGYEVAGRGWQDYTVDNQVGGYITKWANTKLGFATVHGAGHEVPTYKPNVAYWLFKSYLAGDLTNA